MEKLYQILKDHPKCKIVLSYDTTDNTLHILVSLHESCSVPGISTEHVRTIFSARKRLSILVVVPHHLIDDKGANRVICELQWAVNEIEAIQDS